MQSQHDMEQGEKNDQALPQRLPRRIHGGRICLSGRGHWLHPRRHRDRADHPIACFDEVADAGNGVRSNFWKPETETVETRLGAL